MQTKPTMNRTAVTVGAILLGLVVVGAAAIYSASRDNRTAEETASMKVTYDPTAASSSVNAATGADTDTSAATGTKDEAVSEAEGTPAETVSEVPETHVVQEGETLRDISQKYYNDPVYAGDIEVLNQLENPNLLIPGQTLQLPRPDELKR